MGSCYDSTSMLTWWTVLMLHLQHAWNYICPKIPKLLKMLCIFLLKAGKAQRSFSFINWMHSRLSNSITTDLLGAFAIIARQGHRILILKINMCIACVSIHPHRMMASFSFCWNLKNLYLLSVIKFMILSSGKSKSRELSFKF